jgi:addiction module RelE/StbE family toxin
MHKGLRMHVLFHKTFKKQYAKLRQSEQARCIERLRLFAEQQTHPILNNHQLSGTLAPFRSINVGGDLRVLFECVDQDTVHLLSIGTHSELYAK